MGEAAPFFLSAEGVRKSFPCAGGKLDVLKGVDLFLGRGESASIVGESGSGKSTLLHVLGGMDGADSGRVALGVTVLGELGPEARAAVRNRMVGFVFQFHHLLPEFDALENVIMPLLVRGEPRRRCRGKGERLLEELGLSHRSRSRPGQMSGGEQQRLAVGRALAGDPALLLMDEPTGNLDHATGERVMDAVFSAASARGVTCVLVTHNLALANRCARRFRMADGRLSEDAPRRGDDTADALTPGASPAPGGLPGTGTAW